MLKAGVEELTRTFRLHYDTAQTGSSESHGLLLFYAAECGLKAVWLRRNRKRSSDDFPEAMSKKGHDLIMWLKELRVGARIGSAPTLRLSRDNNSLHI